MSLELSSAPGLERNDLLLLLAESADAETHHVAGVEPRLWLHPHAHAGWRACRDHVAGKERHVFRDVGDQRRDAEDHRPRVPGLPPLAIDVEPHVEILRVADFVGRHEPRADRSERVAALALVPLTRALLQLEVSLGDVVDDAVAGDVLER